MAREYARMDREDGALAREYGKMAREYGGTGLKDWKLAREDEKRLRDYHNKEDRENSMGWELMLVEDDD